MMMKIRLTPKTLLIIQRRDITELAVDGVVNAANQLMLGGGGVDGAIHRAAGPELLEACRAVREVSRGVRCPTGEARLTPAFRLPAKWIIHTVGPVYRGPQSARLLRSCYRSCLVLAKEHSIRSIAFPAISCGVYGYPLAAAAPIALETCRDNVGDWLEELHFALFDEESYQAWIRAAEGLA